MKQRKISMDHGSWELWNMEPGIRRVMGLGMFCPLKSGFLDLKPIHQLGKTIGCLSGSTDHGSWEVWIQKANMEPGIHVERGMGLGIFCPLKSCFLDLKLIHQLEKHD